MIANTSLERYVCDASVIANASQTIADTESSARGQRSECFSLWSPSIHSVTYVPGPAATAWMGMQR